MSRATRLALSVTAAAALAAAAGWLATGGHPWSRRVPCACRDGTFAATVAPTGTSDGEACAAACASRGGGAPSVGARAAPPPAPSPSGRLRVVARPAPDGRVSLAVLDASGRDAPLGVATAGARVAWSPRGDALVVVDPARGRHALRIHAVGAAGPAAGVEVFEALAAGPVGLRRDLAAFRAVDVEAVAWEGDRLVCLVTGQERDGVPPRARLFAVRPTGEVEPR